VKRIDAIVRHDRLDAVRESLIALGHHGLTVTEVRGHGLQKGLTQQWRGKPYSVNLLPKVHVMAVVHDHEVHDAVQAICSVARTGMIGDGKIFVSPVETAIRIRTGEDGADAL